MEIMFTIDPHMLSIVQETSFAFQETTASKSETFMFAIGSWPFTREHNYRWKNISAHIKEPWSQDLIWHEQF